MSFEKFLVQHRIKKLIQWILQNRVTNWLVLDSHTMKYSHCIYMKWQHSFEIVWHPYLLGVSITFELYQSSVYFFWVSLGVCLDFSANIITAMATYRYSNQQNLLEDII